MVKSGMDNEDLRGTLQNRPDNNDPHHQRVADLHCTAQIKTEFDLSAWSILRTNPIKIRSLVFGHWKSSVLCTQGLSDR